MQARRAASSRSAVAERMAGSSASQWQQPAGKGLGFYTGEDGYLYCDNMKVDDIRHQVCGCVVCVVCRGEGCWGWAL